MPEPGSWSWLRLYGGLACALAVVVCGATVVAFDLPQPLRAVAAAGLVVWAPGYALTLVLLPPGAIAGVERAVLAFAASLALTAIPAVLLDAVGVRLGEASFVISGCAVTAVAGALALRRLPPLTDTSEPPPEWRSARKPVAIALGVGLVFVVAVIAARVTPEPAGIEGSSLLAATSAGPRSIRAEVISDELRATRYRVTLSTKGKRVRLARFMLEPGGSWQRVLKRPAGAAAVELRLYRGAKRRPYRQVVLPREPA